MGDQPVVMSTATLEDVSKIPGIGPKRGPALIEARDRVDHALIESMEQFAQHLEPGLRNIVLESSQKGFVIWSRDPGYWIKEAKRLQSLVDGGTAQQQGHLREIETLRVEIKAT